MSHRKHGAGERASDAAIKPGSPLLFDTAPDNLCFDWHLGDKTAVDAAFARAHHITRLDLVNNRLVSNPLVIIVKTANALGITVPHNLLGLAD